MLLRRLVYRFMSCARLVERSEREDEKLKMEKDVKKRIKILDDIYDIDMTIIRKNRYNEEFMKMTVDNVSKTVSKCDFAKERV